MNELKVFENQEFGKVRTVTIDGEPWFVGKDVAAVLGYENTKKAIRDHVDVEDKKMGEQNGTPSVVDSMGRTQRPVWINESGMYALIFGSKLPSARRFKCWVTSEVLPAIRRTGSYSKTDIDVTALIMQTATAVCTEMIKQLTPILQSMVAVQPFPVVTAGSGILEAEGIGARCKMETFPAELRLQVDQMFDQMLEQQALNFSMIARYCTMNGFPISQPSVKTYYHRHFASV